MSARRTWSTLAVSATMLLGLSACSKPSPQITLVSGNDSVHAVARQYCHSGAIQNETDCAVDGAPRVTVLRVRQGERVGFDVDKALTDHAWSVYDLDTRESLSGYLDEHYWSYQANFASRALPGVIRLQVTSLGALPTSDTDVPPLQGIWTVNLVQQAG
jgi:hypothetical protein